MDWFDTRLLEIRQETPIDHTLCFAVPSAVAGSFDFVPGQFVVLTDPEAEKPVRRAYSLSSAPGDQEAYEITVRDMGGFGHFLYDAPVGMRLQMNLPQGRFVLQQSAGEEIVLSAGGSGVSPFRSFVRHLRAKGDEQRVRLLQSARQAEELIFRAEFDECASACAWFDYLPTVTRAAQDDPWPGRRGRIDDDALRAAVPHPEATRFYACGPGGFVRAQLEAAKALGIAKERIHKEQWG